MTNVIFTNYTSHIANQYRDYLELTHSLEELEVFVQFYIENYSLRNISESLSEGLENDNSFWIPLRSAFNTIVMMYARIFDSSSDRRVVTIDDQGFPEELKEYHSHLLLLRNKFVGHAGYSMYEKIEYLIGIDTDGHLVTNENVVKRVVFGPGEDDFECKLVPLLGEIKNKINKKLNKLEKKLQEEVGFMECNQVTRGYIMQKIFTRSGVSQNDIDHCREQ